MCGIVGIMSGNGSLDDAQLTLFKRLLYVDQLRGEHATGIAKINPYKKSDRTSIIKKAMPAEVFLGQPEVQDFVGKDRGRILIGHNRYATMGARDDDQNAHPWEDGHITLVHNGTVDKWALDDLSGYSDPGVVVDSHMVCITIAEKGIKEAVEKYLSGAFSLVYWDDELRTLNFIRNDKRPMYIAALTDGTLVWASEEEFIKFWVNYPKAKHSFRKKPELIPTDTLISWKFNENGVLLDGGRPTVTEMKFVEKPSPYAGTFYDDTWYLGTSTTRVDRWSGKQPVVSTTTGHYAQKCTDDMAKAGLTCEHGDEITFRVTGVSSRKGSYTKLFGTYEGTRVVCHTPPERIDWESKVWARARIIAFTEDKINGVSTPEIIVSGSSLVETAISPKQAGELTPSKQQPKTTTTSSSGQNSVKSRKLLMLRRKQSDAASSPSNRLFPMKVDGMTFATQEDFYDATRKGCSWCGMTPLSTAAHNKDMVFYPTGNGEQEFLCGVCAKL